MAQSAASLKKVTLELGGKAPLLVFDDCNFDLAVQTAMDANFYTAGEVCSNATRIFVQDTLKERFISAMNEKTAQMQVGDPMNPKMQMGAMISDAHLQKVLADVNAAEAEGATLCFGGRRLFPEGMENGFYMQPTI